MTFRVVLYGMEGGRSAAVWTGLSPEGVRKLLLKLEWAEILGPLRVTSEGGGE